jgi:TetR/AcrR family transcriptional repressor of mexJK operon
MRSKPASHKLQTRLEQDRVDELLDIAAEVFIEMGFAAASTNEIAKRSNSSKTTFYSRFPTKEKLFIAVLERRMNRVFSEVSTTLPLDGPVQSVLREYGRRVLQFALSEDQLALFRVVSMESTRFPALAERFYQLGPKRGQDYLSGYLEEQIKGGCLVKEDPATMAEHFLSLLTGGRVRWASLGLRSNLGPKDRQKHIDAAVRVYLRAYSTSTTG